MSSYIFSKKYTYPEQKIELIFLGLIRLFKRELKIQLLLQLLFIMQNVLLTALEKFGVLRKNIGAPKNIISQCIFIYFFCKIRL